MGRAQLPHDDHLRSNERTFPATAAGTLIARRETQLGEKREFTQ
jgi:hypothetical protein